MENNQFPQGQDEQVTVPQPEAQPQPAPQAEPELSRQPNFGPQPPMGPQPMDAPQPVQTQVFGCPPAPPQANVQPSAPQPPVYANAPVPPQPPYAPQPGVPGAFPPPAPKQSRGMAIAGLVLGICSLVFFWSPFIGIICGILGLVFGILGKKKQQGGMATAGIITGSIGLFSRQSFQSLKAFGGSHCPIRYRMFSCLATCASRGRFMSGSNTFPFASIRMPPSVLLIFI